MARNGAWPEGGGVGDQTAFARDAFAFVWHEHHTLDAEEIEQLRSKNPT